VLTLLPAPRSVRVAGVLVAVQGLAGLAFAVAVLVLAFGDTRNAGNLYGEAGFFGIMAAAIIAMAVGLILGHRWTRYPGGRAATAADHRGLVRHRPDEAGRAGDHHGRGVRGNAGPVVHRASARVGGSRTACELAGQCGQRVVGQPVARPAVHRRGPERLVEPDGGRVPVQDRPLEPLVAALDTLPRERGE